MEKKNNGIVNRVTLNDASQKLSNLGTALLAFFMGEELNSEQIALIKGASEKEKLLAIECVLIVNLRGQAYTNYCQNKRKLNRKNS